MEWRRQGVGAELLAATEELVSRVGEREILLVEDAFGGVGDGRLAGSREPAEPDHDAALLEQVLLVVAVEETVEFGVDVHGRSLKSKV